MFKDTSNSLEGINKKFLWKSMWAFSADYENIFVASMRSLCFSNWLPENFYIIHMYVFTDLYIGRLHINHILVHNIVQTDIYYNNIVTNNFAFAGLCDWTICAYVYKEDDDFMDQRSIGMLIHRGQNNKKTGALYLKITEILSLINLFSKIGLISQ